MCYFGKVILLLILCALIHSNKGEIDTEDKDVFSRSIRSSNYYGLPICECKECKAYEGHTSCWQYCVCLYSGRRYSGYLICADENCPANDYVWSEWSSFSECSENCTSGYMSRTRQCIDNSTSPATDVSNHRCSGYHTEWAACNEMFCSEYSDWSYSPCLSTCEPGIKLETRDCLDDGMMPDECVIRNIMPCNQEFCSNYTEWMALECSNMCAPGVTMETRTCRGEGCSPIGCTSRNNVECNVDICVEYSDWAPVTDCPVTCGGGELMERRSCLDNGTQISQCLERMIPCNTDMCPDSEEDIDLLVITASTNGVDQCTDLRTAVAPHFANSDSYTAANFPNFFRQNEFLMNLTGAWRTADLDNTRVAIQQHSSACRAENDILDVAAFNEPFSPDMFENLTYYCGSSNIADIFGCAPSFQFTTARGDRPDKRNVMLFLIGNVENILFRELLATAVFEQIKLNIIDPQEIILLTMSTLPLGTLTPEENSNNVEYLKQLGCLSATPVPDCANYIGNVYENPVIVKMRIRDVLDSTL